MLTLPPCALRSLLVLLPMIFACLRHPAEWAEVDRAGIRPVCHRCQKRMWRVNATLPSMAKRGYSREFKPHGETGKRYLLDKIPAGLWTLVREKCKRDGVSVRAQILKLLKEWIDR